MDNCDFCVQFTSKRGGQVLDYGCGNGKIVEKLLELNIDSYGCDVFYEGGDYSESVSEALMGGRIKRMVNDRIPFPDNYFDTVVHNQVFEHIPDLQLALAEISRVLKPGGGNAWIISGQKCVA